MTTLPDKFNEILMMFAMHFSARVWQHARVLVIGAILARGHRTVTAVLRVMGLSDEVHFATYHRVLNRAVWDARTVSRTLMLVLIRTFAPTGELVIGGDETMFAHHLNLQDQGFGRVRTTTWYAKPLPTFSDAIATVRHALWRYPTFHTSKFNQHIAKLPLAVFKGVTKSK